VGVFFLNTVYVLRPHPTADTRYAVTVSWVIECNPLTPTVTIWAQL